MKIIIELDSRSEEQPEIRKLTTPVTEQPYNTNSGVSLSSSPIDAGHAHLPDGSVPESPGMPGIQQLQGNLSFTATGAIDAGAARIQEQTTPAAMSDTGNMAITNQGNAISAGALANNVNN